VDFIFSGKFPPTCVGVGVLSGIALKVIQTIKSEMMSDIPAILEMNSQDLEKNP